MQGTTPLIHSEDTPMTGQLHRRDFLTCTGGLLASTLMPARAAQDQPKKRTLKKAIMYATIGYKGSVLEKFKAIKAAGFVGVEPMSHMNQDEVLKALEATGLQPASVCCNTHWSKPLSHPEERARDEAVEGVVQALKDAKRYGATSILLVPGVVKEPVTYDECWKRSIAGIKKALPVAQELGVKIAIENVWNNFIIKPEQAKQFLDEINNPQVGWHFDIGNVIRYGSPEDWIPVLGKHILKLHIKEFSKVKGFGVKLLEGDNNWPAIMKALDAIGYNGWAISEQPGNQAQDEATLKDLSERMDKVFAR
jgi:hexulose-6-phosphate isomerase